MPSLRISVDREEVSIVVDQEPLSVVAERMAMEHLLPVAGPRWLHVQEVARKATEVAGRLIAPDQAQIVSAAAWLHDIGYAPTIKQTGFHPLDGATWLRERGFNEEVVSLVAFHSCAAIEADLRGLGDALGAFQEDKSFRADILIYADMTTGPKGEVFTVQGRIDEILLRYGPDHLVSRFIHKATRPLFDAAQRVEQKIKDFAL